MESFIEIEIIRVINFHSCDLRRVIGRQIVTFLSGLRGYIDARREIVEKKYYDHHDERSIGCWRK